MLNLNLYSETERLSRLVARGAKTALTDKEFLELEIAKWKRSDLRRAQITGVKYYKGEHDILQRMRTVIGQDGVLQTVENLPNNRIVDNQYAKLVDQKANYLVGQSFSVDTDNQQYAKALAQIFDRRFMRVLRNLCEDSHNCGIAWLYVYYDAAGQICFKRCEPFEILPFWADAEHTKLDCVVRLYEVLAYEGALELIVEKVEVYKASGVERYTLTNGKLVPDTDAVAAHVSLVDADGNQAGFNWQRIPLIAFKYNNKETPLITRVKSLQDGVNAMLSDFQNNMQEDSRNTILVIKNYDGQNLAEFRHNLAAYGAVKVRTIDGAEGGVDTLTVEVNAENYKAILQLLKKAMIENARGFDAKDDRLSNNPNQMNIQSMYSDIDLDANETETEYQASFEELLWFVNAHLVNTGQGDFSSETAQINFKRSVLVNEMAVIESIVKSVGLLSEQTLLAKHPWIMDVNAELERLKKQRAAEAAEYALPAAGGDEE